jgi:oxygen-dependent protoporphyrinogen oxidase
MTAEGANRDGTAGPSIAVIGGGISGLAAAHRLREICPSARVTVLESSQRFGGVLETRETAGCLWETSADNFITNVPAGVGLCRRLGLEPELLDTLPIGRQAYVVRRGGLMPIPRGFALLQPTQWRSIATTRILSPLGKLRLAAERFVPPRREASDESLASFAIRRLGRETFERLVQPLVGGIYTADPARLSMQATLPRFLEMEWKFGSLTRAAQGEQHAEQEAHGARYQLFTALREGMSQLVAKLVERLSGCELSLGARVSGLAPNAGGGWQIELGSHRSVFDGVILATPAPIASTLVRLFDADLSDKLSRIEQAGCLIAVAAYARDDCPGLPAGAGFVVPEIERRKIIACSFSSQKFAGRAPEDLVLLRVFLGGAQHPEVASWDDQEVKRVVASELQMLLGLRGEAKFCEIVRWQGAMPQYHVGHVGLVDAIEGTAARWPGFALAGNAYRGVGIPHCIASGERAAERVLEGLPGCSSELNDSINRRTGP